MIDRRIDCLLWGWQFGRVAPEVLVLELREWLQRLRDESIDVRDSGIVRLWDNALLSEYDDAVHGATRALDRSEWHCALRQIHRCERVIASMRALVQANDDIERAATSMEQVHDRAGTADFRRLPTAPSLSPIVELA